MNMHFYFKENLKTHIVIISMLIVMQASAISWPAEESPFYKIWTNIQIRQKEISSCRGKIEEIRYSPLLREPYRLEGLFYAQNPDKFRLEYVKPVPVKLIFNRDVINLELDRDEKKIEKFNIESAFKRTKEYFSGKNSFKHLSQDFTVNALTEQELYRIHLVPEKKRLKERVKSITVWLGREDYLPNKLEIDGQNGVRSVFIIDIQELNPELDKTLFEVIR